MALLMQCVCQSQEFSVLPKTVQALELIDTPTEYVEQYDYIPSVDMFVGEALNLSTQVIAYHDKGGIKLKDLFNKALCAEIDTIFSSVIKSTKDFKTAVECAKSILGT